MENEGRPSGRVTGLGPEAPPESGAAVFDGDGNVGEVTRADYSPALDAPIAMALVEYGLETDELAVRIDGEDIAAEAVELPFIDGSARSRRLPEY